jgi:hypothetical protein
MTFRNFFGRLLLSAVLLLAAVAPLHAERVVDNARFEDAIFTPGEKPWVLHQTASVLRGVTSYYVVALYVRHGSAKPKISELRNGTAAYRAVLVWTAPALSKTSVQRYWQENLTASAGGRSDPRYPARIRLRP